MIEIHKKERGKKKGKKERANSEKNKNELGEQLHSRSHPTEIYMDLRFL